MVWRQGIFLFYFFCVSPGEQQNGSRCLKHGLSPTKTKPDGGIEKNEEQGIQDKSQPNV